MGKADKLVIGQWNAICDRCRWKFKNVELQKEWTGLMVCKDCWEPRHPQDFVKVRIDEQALPWTRPEPTDTFIDVDYVADTVGVQENTIPAGTNTGDSVI